MEKFSARAFYLIGYALAAIHLAIAEEVMPTQYPVLEMDCSASDALREKVGKQLSNVAEFCKSIDLDMSANQASRLTDKLNGVISPNQIGTETRHLKNLISDEMKGKLFVYLPAGQAKFFGLQEPFGEEVARKFPSASFDAGEAANCYATARSTACVFHLMRVLEIGLTALGKVFSVSLQHTNWAPAIDQIESKIREMGKDPTWKGLPDWKDQQEFYAQAASFLGVVKDAWRNYTAHARGRYTQDQAELMFMNVKAFMEKIAQRM